jgi:hypothetical protein
MKRKFNGASGEVHAQAFGFKDCRAGHDASGGMSDATEEQRYA